MATNQGGPPAHADLVARLRELADAPGWQHEDELLQLGDYPGGIGQDDFIPCHDERRDVRDVLREIADALAALPPPADPPRAAFDAMEMAVYGKPGNTMTPEQIVRWRDFLYQWCLPADPPALVALREAEDATWAGAVSYVRDMAATVRAMAQKFVADSVMAELAEVRAEALDNCADGMERAAKKAKGGR